MRARLRAADMATRSKALAPGSPATPKTDSSEAVEDDDEEDEEDDAVADEEDGVPLADSDERAAVEPSIIAHADEDPVGSDRRFRAAIKRE